MCGRYALGIRASFVRYQLREQGLPVDDAPGDEEARETFNFPPGAFGLVYRAEVPDHGVRDEEEVDQGHGDHNNETNAAPDSNDVPPTQGEHGSQASKSKEDYKYEIKVMKWGLIPFWTKRSPDYSSMLRTINCRDDSLLENRGMWNTMKQRKRCVVVAQGFYEWLKKGKDKLPHFVTRPDGKLMCFAGLWDCVKYEDSDEKLYTYTIITTDSNQQLKFLHDRMPVILDAGSEAMRTWLDPTRNKWSKELQSLMKPYAGELLCYPVSKEVGKVGNNSPDFIVPIDSKNNKNNIANFFGGAKKAPEVAGQAKTVEVEVKKEETEQRDTVEHEGSEDNAPLPVPRRGLKRPADHFDGEKLAKAPKMESAPTKESPSKQTRSHKARSATTNETTSKKSPAKKAEDGTQRITNFFVK